MRPTTRLTVACAAVLGVTTGALVTMPVAASAATGCSVSYTVSSQWPGGFQGSVVLTNVGDALNGWTLTFNFPDAGQKVTQGWAANWSQSGTAVTATAASWNASLATGAKAELGFIGGFTGSNPVPSSFAVNGVACNGGTGGTTTTTTTQPTTTTTSTRATTTTTRTTTTTTTSRTTTTTSTGAAKTFTNPLVAQGPDPWMQYYNGYYYLATTTWNRTITMRKSATIEGLKTAQAVVIQNLTRANGAGTMWAPEFHLLNGPNGQRWYFYYTAGQEPYDLGTQRLHVLESSGLDPMGPYTWKADLLDPTQDNTWELDGSILQLDGKLYLMGTFYNGSQPMFIRPLSNPWTASGTRHILSTPTYSWETVGGAVNEGPEAIQHDGKTYIVFSASHCSTPDYKLGLLTWNGSDPLQASSWVKSSQPIFTRSDANGVYGPGHNGFFSSPDGTETWMVYHANSSVNGGCDLNRSTRVQKISWNADGSPNLGVPVKTGTPIAVPSGEQ